MLDSVPFPQHFPTKSTLCGPKLMCFRNPNSWPCFSQAYVSSCEWVGVKTTPREEEGRPAAATPSHGTDVRLPGCVDRESRRTISRSVVWRDRGRAGSGSLSLPHSVWGLGSVPRRAPHLGTLHRQKAKGSQGKELPAGPFSWANWGNHSTRRKHLKL